jgi:GT2 family glycosyltransferase
VNGISFITVSRDEKKTGQLVQSIQHSMGLPPNAPDWEHIVQDGQSQDLFRGYNQGAATARFDLLAFVHDDVRFLGNRDVWTHPMALARKPLVGIVGVAGSRRLEKEGVWWKAEHTQLRGAVAHPADNEFGMHWNVWPWQAGQFGPVAVTDGVFMLIAKQTFEAVGGFSQDQYQGFHFYDLDLSFRLTLKGFRNLVAPIPLLHRSVGVPNENWHRNREIFVKRFGSKLPYDLGC